MSFFGTVKKFLRGGDGIKGPAKTPPMPFSDKVRRTAADEQSRVARTYKQTKPIPEKPSATAERTKIQMRQARERRRHQNNVGARKQAARLDQASRRKPK